MTTRDTASGLTVSDVVEGDSLTAPGPALDCTTYPHILDRIIELAPRAALLPLRATCRALRKRADARLWRHAVGHYLHAPELWYARNTNMRYSPHPVRILDIDYYRLQLRCFRGTLPFYSSGTFSNDNLSTERVHDKVWDKLARGQSPGLSFPAELKLIRLLPQPLFLEGEDWFPFYPHWPPVPLEVANQIVVTFANVHVDSEDRRWSHAPRQIANLLYHPGCTRDRPDAFPGINDCVSGIYQSTGSAGEDAFVLLTPEGVPPLPWGDGGHFGYRGASSPGEAGMLTVLVNLLADTARSHRIHRRIVLVGWERWPHAWLDRRLTYRGDEIHEEGTADLPVAHHVVARRTPQAVRQ